MFTDRQTDRKLCRPELDSGSHGCPRFLIKKFFGLPRRTLKCTPRNDADRGGFFSRFALKHSLAFTLAEVLITLGIIGIVAEMTIPTLVQNTQEKVIVVSLKKAYSVLTQAYIMTVNDNGTPNSWALSEDYAGSKVIMDNFAKYMNVIKRCDAEVGCFPQGTYKLENSTTDWHDFYSSVVVPKAQLADGSIILVSSYANCNGIYGTSAALQNVCGWIGVDVNGAKKPNALGRDFFAFHLTETGIVPLGEQAYNAAALDFDNGCKTQVSASGYGCTAWVIYNENLDYLKCNNLSWDGPTKCN